MKEAAGSCSASCNTWRSVLLPVPLTVTDADSFKTETKNTFSIETRINGAFQNKILDLIFIFISATCWRKAGLLGRNAI